MDIKRPADSVAGIGAAASMPPSGTPFPYNQVLRRRQAAAYCNVSLRTWEKWEANGMGPPVIRVGRTVLFRLTDIDAWLESRKVRKAAA